MAIFKSKVAYALIAVGIVIGSAFVGFSIAERYFVRQTNGQSDASLRLAASGLSGALQKFEAIPTLLADQPIVRSLLSGSPSEQDFNVVNKKLKSVAQEVGASDIYVMDENGLTIAASNFDLETTFLGKNYTFRPYFTEAMRGEHGRYYALGIASLKRGYYFSAPVISDGRAIGVMAVKFSVDKLENEWKRLSHNLIVTDPNGIIFMSNIEDWLFSSLHPLSDETLAHLRESQRYPIDQITPLDASITITENETRLAFSQESGGTVYLVRSEFMPQANWTLHILTPRATVFAQSMQVAVVAGLVAALLTVLTVALLAWRSRQALRIHEQEEAKQLLEARVAERTKDLQREIGERTQAEKELRKAQNELVQAGKLAALGQMSASLSHELNQPLSAVKTYADNAGAFLDRDRFVDVRSNLMQISALTDRMAQISNSLRNFARKPREKIGSVKLSSVLADVEQLMVGRISQTKASLSISPVPDDLSVIGGHVRLQQVLVNLINNALDSMEDQPTSSVEVSIVDLGKTVEIQVKDHGRGIEEDIFEKIFDPFFTTKGVNQGLGLGLSISFNILRDFGGNLTAKNLPTGGAVFSATLNKAIVEQKAVE